MPHNEINPDTIEEVPETPPEIPQQEEETEEKEYTHIEWAGYI